MFVFQHHGLIDAFYYFLRHIYTYNTSSMPAVEHLWKNLQPIGLVFALADGTVGGIDGELLGGPRWPDCRFCYCHSGSRRTTLITVIIGYIRFVWTCAGVGEMLVTFYGGISPTGKWILKGLSYVYTDILKWIVRVGRVVTIQGKALCLYLKKKKRFCTTFKKKKV